MSPISFRHISFWCTFLDPYLTTHHFNVDVQLREVTELGLLKGSSAVLPARLFLLRTCNEIHNVKSPKMVFADGVCD